MGEVGESVSSGIPGNRAFAGRHGRISAGSTVSDGRREYIDREGRLVCIFSGTSTGGVLRDKLGTEALRPSLLLSAFGPSDAARSSLITGWTGSEGCRILIEGLLLPLAIACSFAPALSSLRSKHFEGPTSKKSLREGRPVRIFVEARAPFAPVR